MTLDCKELICHVTFGLFLNNHIATSHWFIPRPLFWDQMIVLFVYCLVCVATIFVCDLWRFILLTHYLGDRRYTPSQKTEVLLSFPYKFVGDHHNIISQPSVLHLFLSLMSSLLDNRILIIPIASFHQFICVPFSTAPPIFPFILLSIHPCAHSFTHPSNHSARPLSHPCMLQHCH